MGGRAVVDVVAPGIGTRHLESLCEAPVQLQRKPVVRGIAPRHEAHNRGTVKAGVGKSRDIVALRLNLGKGGAERVQVRLRGLRQIGGEEQAERDRKSVVEGKS